MLSIDLSLHVGMCDSCADVTCGGSDDGTRKCDVRWSVKKFEVPHMLMMHMDAYRVLMIRDIMRKVKSQSSIH